MIDGMILQNAHDSHPLLAFSSGHRRFPILAFFSQQTVVGHLVRGPQPQRRQEQQRAEELHWRCPRVEMDSVRADIDLVDIQQILEMVFALPLLVVLQGADLHLAHMVA
jgi:hypothetical protein